jgi:predicted transcriptional regulator
LARTPCADADRAAEVAGVHHLIVLDDEGRWAGILCRCDLAGGGAAPVGERMSRDIYAVGPATPLRVALGAMKQLGVGSLPVVDGQRLVGVLSSRHVRRAGIADIE